MSHERKRVLLVDDDSDALASLSDALKAYPAIELVTVGDGYSVMAEVTKIRPAALLLDIMMPYGAAHPDLVPSGDLDEDETGLRVLASLRVAESRDHAEPVWVAVITARSPNAVGGKAKDLLAGRGAIYYKPFDTLRLEDDLARALKIESRVPSCLLPKSRDSHEPGSDGGPS